MDHSFYINTKDLNDFQVIDLEILPKIIQDNWMYLLSENKDILSVKDKRILKIKSKYKSKYKSNGRITLSFNNNIEEWIVMPNGTGLDGSQILYPFHINEGFNAIPQIKKFNELQYQELMFNTMINSINCLKYLDNDDINIKELLSVKKAIEEIISIYNIKDILE